MEESDLNAREAEIFEGRVIIRRFTDQLEGADELEQSTQAAQAEIDEEESAEERRRLQQYFEDADDNHNSPRDFDVAEIAKTALQETVNEFNENAKPSTLQRMGFSTKTTKEKAIEVLASTANGNLEDLKASIDNLDESWKERHGMTYGAFKKLCGTLDDHKSVLALFPWQNSYASVLCGGLSCLVMAAKNHSDIGATLSESVATISDKVTTCSSLVQIIRTRRLRRKLAHIYSHMFEFYKDAIRWYLRSRISRAFGSFNENLKKRFDDAVGNIDDRITELYREASVSKTAMTAIILGELSDLRSEIRRQRPNYQQQDTAAGRRMIVMLESSWRESRFREGALESSRPIRLIEPASRVQEMTISCISRTQARAYGATIERFIIGDEGPGLLGTASHWVAEDGLLPRLREWTAERESPRILWISSPHEVACVTSARAAALAVVAAAWQAETPVISHFCQRPQRHMLRPGMSIEEVGLLGLVYSLIGQLLQFSDGEDELAIGEETMGALDGRPESWGAGLVVLRELLVHTPMLTFCVIDGLNELEWGSGAAWSRQLFDVLLQRQRQTGTVFNILLTTAGQSQVLPPHVQLKDRCISTKQDREVERTGRRIELRQS